MPTLITISKNFDMGNDEIDRNVGFALEPINKFALPSDSKSKYEHDQLYCKNLRNTDD